MGIYNREYMRDEDHGGGARRGGPRQWTALTWIIVVNVVVFLAQVLYFDADRVGTVTRAELLGGHVYLLFTYMFVHADPLHLGFNMLILYFWGYQLQDRLGTWRFLGLYAGSGLFGALVQLAWSPAPILGASACVLGVIFGFIALIPRQEVNLLIFFVFPLRATMWKIGAFIVTLEVVLFLAEEVGGLKFGEHGIAHLAHLGGAFFGWLWVARILPRLEGRGPGRTPPKVRSGGSGPRRVVEGRFSDAPQGPAGKSPQPFISAEVDAILDKISAQGMQSLTDEEKRLLHQSSEKLSRRMDEQ